MTVTNPVVEVSVDSGVMTITMVDEANRNTLGAALLNGLMDAIDRAEADDAIRVIVITNSGSVFCAGANLNTQTTGGEQGETTTFSMTDLFMKIRRSRLPIVGRIAGHAVAGGLGLAAAMDISVAVDTAKHGFTEVRIGVAPAIISVVCLPKMRTADAAEAMLRGNRFNAPEAVRLGLINKAVPASDLDAEVDLVVQDLLAGGPGALAATKQLLATVPEMDAAAALDWTGDLSARLFRTDEAQAGMSAYLTKQPAPWAPQSEEPA